MNNVHPESVLLITLDSCRHDTAQNTKTPSFDRVSSMHEAMAPGHFTLASHSAMWVGTTPGIPGAGQPILDPKTGRLFKLVTHQIKPRSGDEFVLKGATIIEGFGELGYKTIGTGAVDWFDPETPAGARLTQDFDEYLYVRRGDAHAQASWVEERIGDEPVFVFINAGETHVPYWHSGASWPPHENPCIPYGNDNDRGLCELRQSACLQHIDRALSEVVRSFLGATIMITADHGDAWGEDGLWEHGTWHPVIMRVPLWVRVRGQPCELKKVGDSSS